LGAAQAGGPVTKETASRPNVESTTVPSDVYSRDYFLTECDGHDEFLSGRMSARLLAALRLVGPLEGKKILDVGSGRGEVTLFCARDGADAYGVDYAGEALTLTKAAQARLSVSPDQAHFQLADSQHLPFRTGGFDIAFMLDIAEHLYPKQLDETLREVHRVLAGGGMLIIHTMPNLWYYRWGYPLYRAVQRLRGKALPRDPRQRWQYVPEVHVNEQDVIRLSRSLREAGWSARIWLEPTQTYQDEKNPAVRWVMRVLSTWYPFRWIFCDDIFAVARKRS
jgi:ubiquinone/menaquinone biosynthesis C-methylase UbiE